MAKTGLKKTRKSYYGKVSFFIAEIVNALLGITFSFEELAIKLSKPMFSSDTVNGMENVTMSLQTLEFWIADIVGAWFCILSTLMVYLSIK